MTRRGRAADPLQRIPGIGPRMAEDLRALGIESVAALARRNPEHMYRELERLTGTRQDPCVLYVFRCAVYFARTERPDPDLLKWWNWKGRTLEPDVERLGTADVPAVVSVLSEAFSDYPVMRHVLGPSPDYRARLRALVTFFVMNRVVRDETLLGIRAGTGLAAAALVSYPGRGSSSTPAEALEWRERTWVMLGEDARIRYEAFGAATSAFAIDAPHIHLNMIGVRDAARGQGLGRILLEAVHAHSAADPSSTGVTLTTEDETNVPLYEHFGYEVVGRAEVGGAFTTWGFYRRDPSERGEPPALR